MNLNNFLSSLQLVIEPKQVFNINHKLRSLGFNFNLTGTKLMNKMIQLVISSKDEFYVLENILDELLKIYPTFNKTQIRMALSYS